MQSFALPSARGVLGFAIHVEEHAEVVIQALSDRRLLHPPISVPMTGHQVQLTLIPGGASAAAPPPPAVDYHENVTEGDAS